MPVIKISLNADEISRGPSNSVANDNILLHYTQMLQIASKRLTSQFCECNKDLMVISFILSNNKILSERIVLF